MLKPVAIVPEKILPPNGQEVKKYAQAVEAMGYWGVTCKDHVVLGEVPDGNNGYTNSHPFQEPLTLFSFFSGVTERLRMISGVLVLPQRPTALVAKTAQSVSDLSAGRLILGVGVGSNKTEFAALGADMQNRGHRIEEQIAALKGLWNNPYHSYSTGTELGQQVGINPRPTHRIPIWIGGWAQPVLERTAKLADGWAPMGDPSDAERLLPSLHALLEKNGRDPENFDIFGAFATSRRGNQTPDTHEQREKDLEHWVRLGATCVAYGKQYPELGTGAMDAHLEDLNEHIELFRRTVGDDVA